MAEDKIEFGMSRKITDGNFGSVEARFSYSTSVKKGEKLEKATDRCIEYVANIMKEKIEELNELVG